jgi:hypothetical protein
MQVGAGAGEALGFGPTQLAQSTLTLSFNIKRVEPRDD